MSDQFWNILAGTVFVIVSVILWLHQRWCKAKGIKPKPAFNRFKKHEKRIAKWSDIFIVVFILLIGFGYSPMISFFNDDTLPISSPEIVQMKKAIGFMLLFQYSFWAVFMASLLSPFQKNITLIKRLILTVMCCVPLVFGMLYCVFDNSQSNQFHLKLLLGGLFSLVLINGPAILLGKPFIELMTLLCNKIRSWLGFPEWEENDSD